jgi:hypothetical protein
MPREIHIPWWAEDPWWETPEYAPFVSRNATKFRIAVSAMQRYFDRAWWADVPKLARRNCVAARLTGKGTMVLGFIDALGSAVASLEDSEGFRSKMARLKDDDSGSTVFEFLIAGYLRAGGLAVKFPAENNANRTPDIVADWEGNRIAVECKRLQVEEWEQWAMDIGLRVLNDLPGDAAKRYSIQIELDPRLSEIRTDDGKYPRINPAVAEAITYRIGSAVGEVVATAPQLPYQFTIAGLGAAVLRDKNEKIETSLSGFSISPISQLRRILTNGLWRAVDQIPRGLPGIVVIQCEHLPDPDFARLVLDAITRHDPSRFGRLWALLLVPRLYLNDARSALLFINRNSAASERAPTCELALSALRKHLDPQEA